MQTLTTHAAALLDIHLTSEQVGAFEQYARELVSWNEKMNLTAITEPEAVQVRHFLDSLTVIKVAPMRDGLRLIDVGTGAGFPGLPLAIVYPNIHVTLLEATGKKVTFLEHIIQTLGLKNASAVKARAEEAAHDKQHRHHYDVVVARAVARMPALMEYLLPFSKVNGLCIAMKGDTAEQEAADAQYALQILGGRVHRIEQLQLPGVEKAHFLVSVQKTDRTPNAYPRSPGIPTRQPL